MKAVISTERPHTESLNLWSTQDLLEFLSNKQSVRNTLIYVNYEIYEVFNVSECAFERCSYLLAEHMGWFYPWDISDCAIWITEDIICYIDQKRYSHVFILKSPLALELGVPYSWINFDSLDPNITSPFLRDSSRKHRAENRVSKQFISVGEREIAKEVSKCFF